MEGLKDHLLKPELVAAFIEGFQAEMARARESERAQRAKAAKKRMEIDRKIGALVRAIEDGMYEPSMKDRMQALREEKTLLAPDKSEDGALDLEVLLHPNLPALYRRQIERLADNIQRPDSEEAFMLLRSMIDRVELVPRVVSRIFRTFGRWPAPVKRSLRCAA